MSPYDIAHTAGCAGSCAECVPTCSYEDHQKGDQWLTIFGIVYPLGLSLALALALALALSLSRSSLLPANCQEPPVLACVCCAYVFVCVCARASVCAACVRVYIGMPRSLTSLPCLLCVCVCVTV